MYFMWLFSSFTLSIILISPFFLSLVKMIDTYSPGQCSPSSIAPLCRKLFFYWSIAILFLLKKIYYVWCWFKIYVMISKISEPLVILALYSLYKFKLTANVLLLYTCSCLAWLEFDVCVALDKVCNVLGPSFKKFCLLALFGFVIYFMI